MLVCEEVFLLLRRNDGKAESAFSQNGYGLAAAVITDLILHGRLVLSDDKDPRVGVVSPAPPGHPALDRAIERIATKNGRKLSSLVTDGKLDVTDEVGYALAGQGVVEVVEKKALGLIAARYPEANPAPEAHLRERLRVVLAGGTPSVVDAGVLSILQGLDLAHKLLETERGTLSKKQLKYRIEAVAQEAGRGSEVSDAVRKAVEAMNTAIMTAVFVSTVAAGGAAT